MKKILIVLLAVLMLLSIGLVACNPETPDTPEDPDDSEKLTGEYAVDMDIPANPNPGSDYTLERGSGQKQVIIYWREKGHDYSDNDVWLWADGMDGQAYELHSCEYGAKTVVNVPSGSVKVGFILRKDATVHTGSNWGTANKVYPDDRFITLTGDVTEVYLTGANAYIFTSNDGGKTLKMIKGISKMTISDMDAISYGVMPSTTLKDKSQVKVVDSDGREVEIESVSTVGIAAAAGTIKFSSELDLSKTYTVTIEGFGEKAAIPMEVFDSEEFVERYTYEGDDLGAVVTPNGTTFKVWAPTATKVVLNLFSAGDGVKADQSVDMTLGEKGVWSYSADGIGHGKYYTYTVTTAAGTQEAVDPYAKSAGLNGERGMVVDLSQTDPVNFESEKYVKLDSYTEAIIWEAHIRDFSNSLKQSQHRGKYLGMIETGLVNDNGIPVGIDYVRALGVTHIHIMPAFDFKSVDESKNTQFNWGYDPQHYNVPEGSYSSDPRDGAVRVNEFKQMVQGLHAQGLGVIMDVVYNHTYDSNSNLNKVVPNYYYRYNDDGTNSGGSGCGNDTASERAMFSKYMVDSVSYWMKEYKLDGFRFDLMGLHDVKTMQKIEQAVHAINPSAILYGEGWTMTTATDATLATQPNMNSIKASAGAAGSIAVFNDAIRDGLRGSVFDAADAGYLGDATSEDMLKVKFGLMGGEKAIAGGANWEVKNAGVINYISAHDNNTLYDKLKISCPKASEAQILAMNRMGAAIVMVSKGTPFMQAGEEMLRSKPKGDGTYDENSYNSSDAINNLKWASLSEESDGYQMFLYYKGLIEMRKASKTLSSRNSTVTVTNDRNKCFFVTFDDGQNGKVVVVINPNAAECSYTLPAGNWSLVCNGIRAGATEIEEASGAVKVAGCSVNVYFEK